MAISAIATFTTADNLEIELAIILLGFLTVGSMSMTLWVLLGASLQKLLLSQRQLRVFNISMAILLALSVVSMAIPDIDIGS